MWKNFEFYWYSKNADSVTEAIERQSFNAVKEKFLENGESNKASFLRKGTIEQWRKDLSKKEIIMFSDLMKKELDLLDYDSKP